MNNLEAARAVLESLCRSGVGLVVHAPGARNLPLLAALMEMTEVERVACVDERAAAFLALGWMRGQALAHQLRPAVVLCTSGTAALNLLPATAEALEGGLPLIVLTADRPAEEIGRGANQTVDQLGPFRSLVRAQLNLPCAHTLDPQDLREKLSQSLWKAVTLQGPLHINLPFAEPLLESPGNPSAQNTAPGDQPACPPIVPPGFPASELALLEALRAGAGQGLVWICDLPRAEDRRAARELAEQLQWPILADGGCGVCHQDASPVVMDAESALPLLEDAGAVLQLGKRPISRRVAEALRHKVGLVVDAHPGRQDPAGAQWLRWWRSPQDALAALKQMSPTMPAATPHWRERCRVQQERAQLAQARTLSEALHWSEALILRRVCATLPAQWGLFAGNSLPVRLLDQWRPPLEHDLQVAANRGLSGIDGLLATALGFQRGLGQPTALLLGDLSLRHDAGSLALLAELGLPLLVVAVHNGGGGIFRLHRDSAAHAWARQDHQLDLARLAAGYGVEASSVDHAEALQAQLDSFRDRPRPMLVQCRVPGEDHGQRLRSLALHLKSAPTPAPSRRVWVHGFLGAAEDWDRLRAALPPANDLVLRLPGHGTQPDPVPESPAAWVAWLLEQWPEDECVELVGYSMGGRLALAAALKAPRRVGRLILLGANPGVEGAQARAERVQRDEAWAHQLVTQGLDSFLAAWYAQPLFAPLMERPDAAALLAHRATGQADALAQVLRTMSPGRQPSQWSLLGELALPVTWAAGSRDIAYLAYSQRGCARSPQGRRVVVPGAGHALPLEAPEALAQLLWASGNATFQPHTSSGSSR